MLNSGQPRKKENNKGKSLLIRLLFYKDAINKEYFQGKSKFLKKSCWLIHRGGESGEL